MQRKNLAFVRGSILFSGLLLSLLVLSMRATPLAIFLQFNLARDELAVFARPVIYAAAFTACDSYELFLRHCRALYLKIKRCANRGLLFTNLVPRAKLPAIGCESLHQSIYY